MNQEIFDVAIIGSGPAGLTAGIYTSRANLKTLVLAGTEWGGQLMLTTTVENYPGFPDGIEGPDLMAKMKSQAEKFGTKLLFENATKIEKHNSLFIIHNSTPRSTRAVIIATGAETQWLGLPNEQRLVGHGVSSCAPCDAFFFKGKSVAVVGGGDSAMEEALVLTKFASGVTIIHRRDTFRASKIMVNRVLAHPKVKVIFNTEVIDILGQDKVEGLKLSNNSNLSVDGVFIAIGHKPNSQIFGDLVEIDEKGYISLSKVSTSPTWPTMSTKTPGVFIAGDVHDHRYKQAVTAAGFGCQAALDVERWLENNANRLP